MNSASGFTRFICSLSFLVAILGYPIAMALLSPWGMGVDLAGNENRLFTWTYRAGAVFVSLLALARVYNRPIPRFDWRMGLLVLFWGLYLLRAFWDLQISTPITERTVGDPNFRFQAWCYILLFTLLPMIVTLKSIDLIDFRRVQNWIFYAGGLGVVCALWANYSRSAISWSLVEGRTDASAMLNTISYGHLGLTVAVVAVCRLLERKNLFRWVSCLGIALLGVYAMLQAGSRGPLLALFFVVLFYALARSRYAMVGIVLGVFFAGVVWAFMGQIIGLIRRFSETMASRLEATLIEGDTSGRDSLFSAVWNACLDSPLTGFRLDFLGYSHNACLDGFMMFGFIFGWIVLALVLLGYKASYSVLKLRLPQVWVALIFVQYITACQTSGIFGANAAVQCLLVVLFVLSSRTHLQNFEKKARLLKNQQAMNKRNWT